MTIDADELARIKRLVENDPGAHESNCLEDGFCNCPLDALPRLITALEEARKKGSNWHHSAACLEAENERLRAQLTAARQALSVIGSPHWNQDGKGFSWETFARSQMAIASEVLDKLREERP